MFTEARRLPLALERGFIQRMDRTFYSSAVPLPAVMVYSRRNVDLYPTVPYR
jgi:hypothetical protein